MTTASSKVKTTYKLCHMVCVNCGTDYEIAVPVGSSAVMTCAERVCLGLALVEDTKTVHQQMLKERPEK